MKLSILNASRRAFTLVEMVVVVGILTILTVAVLFPAISDSKSSSVLASNRGTVKTLSDAARRVLLKRGSPGIPDSNPGLVPITAGVDLRADTIAAAEFYYNTGFIREMPSLDGVQFDGGEWQLIPTP